MSAKPKGRTTTSSQAVNPPESAAAPQANSSGERRNEADNSELFARYTEIARLAGALAHEIKNPLSTIRLNMELLAEDFAESDSPRDKRALKKISIVERECGRLQSVLDDFLNFAKVRQLKLQATDLNREVQRVIEFFRPKAQESHIEIVCYLDPNLPNVRVDAEAFHGALLNLVLNAQQAMPDGGQLVARTKCIDGQVSLDLIDTGVGMSTETVEHIFDAFYSTKPGGSGLGLPTARKVIESHGGTIAVDSEIGRGTKFTITLPAVQ